MDDLNFPVFKEEPRPHRNLSMDEYARFVFLLLRAFPNKALYEDQKKESLVNVPFKLNAAKLIFGRH